MPDHNRPSHNLRARAALAVAVVGVVAAGFLAQFAGAQIDDARHPVGGDYNTYYYVVPVVAPALTDAVATTEAGNVVLTGGLSTGVYTITVLVRRSTATRELAEYDERRYADASLFVTLTIADYCQLVGDNLCPALQFENWSATIPAPVTINKILAAGATLTAAGEDGMQAAHFAASVNNTAAMSALIVLRAESATLRDNAGWTPAHFAALGTAAAMLTLLGEQTNPSVNLNAAALDGARPADAAPQPLRPAMTLLGATICFRNCAGTFSPQPLTASLVVTQWEEQTYPDNGAEYSVAFGRVGIGGGYLHGNANYAFSISYSDTLNENNPPANAFDNPAHASFPMEITLSAASVLSRNVTTGATAARAGVFDLTVYVKLRGIPDDKDEVTATLVVNDLPDAESELWSGVAATEPVTLLFTVTATLEDLPVTVAGNERVQQVTAGVFKVVGSVRTSDPLGARASLLAFTPLDGAQEDNFRATIISDGESADEFFLVAAVSDPSQSQLTFRAKFDVADSLQETQNFNTTILAWTVDVATRDEVILIGGASNLAGLAYAEGSIVWAANASDLTRWTARATIADFAVRGHRAVNFNGTLVMIGGRRRQGPESSSGANTKVYWSADRGATWQSYVNTDVAQRVNSGMVVHKGYLYVVGGQNQFNTYSISRRNDWWRTNNVADSSSWQTGAKLPYPVTYPNLFSMNGTLYVGGGVSGANYEGYGRARLLKFDDTSLTWRTDPDDRQIPARNETGGDIANLRNPIQGDVAVLQTSPPRAVYLGLANEAIARNNSVYIYNGGRLSDAANWTVCAPSDIDIKRAPHAIEVRGRLHVFAGGARDIKIMSNANGCPVGANNAPPVTISAAIPAGNEYWTRAMYVGDFRAIRNKPLPQALFESGEGG